MSHKTTHENFVTHCDACGVQMQIHFVDQNHAAVRYCPVCPKGALIIDTVIDTDTTTKIN